MRTSAAITAMVGASVPTSVETSTVGSFPGGLSTQTTVDSTPVKHTSPVMHTSSTFPLMAAGPGRGFLTVVTLLPS
jgi:hypothetical protein